MKSHPKHKVEQEEKDENNSSTINIFTKCVLHKLYKKQIKLYSSCIITSEFLIKIKEINLNFCGFLFDLN